MLDHLSYSSINTYLLCPRSWRYRYVDKMQVPKSAALIFGSAFHDTIEGYLLAKAGQAEINPAERFRAEWERQLARTEVAWGGDDPDDLLNLGQRMLRSKLTVTGGGSERKETAAEFLSAIAPAMDDGQPIIEKRIELWAPGVPIPVIGYVDVITADGVPCDFKTSSRAWYADKAHSELQPTFYLAGLQQMGLDAPGGKFRYYVFVKTKTPKAQIIETKRTANDVLWTLGMVSEIYQAIHAGAFPPNPTGWKCNSKYCEYFEVCR